MLDHDFAAALNRTCYAINWDYGEVWIPNPETALLELSPIWYAHPNLSSDRLYTLQQFRACSEKFVLLMGEGLPGRIWQSRHPEWIQDVSLQSEDYFLRHQIAKAFNIKAGFGCPVFDHEAIAAILIFFSDRACKEDRALIQLAMTVMATVHEK